MYSTACTTISGDTIPDRTVIVTLDSVKKLVPRGYYVLNEQGARLSIKAKIDAVAFQQKWQIADGALSKMTIQMGIVTMQRDLSQQANIHKDETIKRLTSKLKWANFFKYAAIVGVAVLGTKLILTQ